MGSWATFVGWGAVLGLLGATACKGSSVVNDVGDMPIASAGKGGTAAGASGKGGSGQAGDDSGGSSTMGGTSGTGGLGGTGGTAGDESGGSSALGGRSGEQGGTAGTEGGSAPVGGTGGSVTPDPAGGAAGDDDGGCTPGQGCPLVEAEDIRAFASDADHIYWVEYGTSDSLGNYHHDGSLHARNFDGTNEQTLAADLDGPMGLAVTAGHAYIYLDGGEDYVKHQADLAKASLVRVQLGGSEPELVLEGASAVITMGGWCEADCIAGGPTDDFFTSDGVIYRLDHAAGAGPEVVLDDQVASRLVVDDDYLYFQGIPTDPAAEHLGLLRVPLAGGTPELVTPFDTDRFAIRGDDIYVIELVEDTTLDSPYHSYLSRTPKDGSGSFTRIAALGDNYAAHLAWSGERFFVEVWPQDSQATTLKTGLLTDPQHVQPTDIAWSGDGVAWKPSPVGILWLDAGWLAPGAPRLRVAPIPEP